LSKKYRIPVSIQTVADKNIGFVEVDSIEEYNEKAEKLWRDQGYAHPRINITNDFNLNDWDLSPVSDDDLKYHKIENGKDS
jgi:hypothetical protein